MSNEGLLERLNKGKQVRNTIKHYERFRSCSASGRMASSHETHCWLWQRKPERRLGKNGFTYGLLYANELWQAEAARRAVRDLA